MYIAKINEFLPKYKNYERNQFLQILEYSNTQKFDISKFEKDFLLTLILAKFGSSYPDLIFKGGTCLNKIYFPYFRLSEDLDFVISKDIGRTARQTLLRKYEEDFVRDLSILGLKLREGRNKFDEHKLAMFVFEYASIIDNSFQTIKIDISLKNTLLREKQSGVIQSIFKDTIFEEDIFGTHTIYTMHLVEMLAEKMRAALTRSTPAIRDFFDIWYVKHNSDFDFEERDFLALLDIKLAETNYIYTLEENFENLKKQVQTDLKPVLNDDVSFHFEEIYDFILSFKK